MSLCHSCSAGLILFWGNPLEVYSLGYKVVSLFDVYLHQIVVINATGGLLWLLLPEMMRKPSRLIPEQGEVRQGVAEAGEEERVVLQVQQDKTWAGRRSGRLGGASRS